MKRPHARFASVMFAVPAVLFVACGDDEDPAAVDSPCDDANTTCVAFTVTAGDADYSEIFDAPFNYTTHRLEWDVDSQLITDFAPGQRVLIDITFSPPVEVRYDHPESNVVVRGGILGGCFDRSVLLSGTVISTDWTTALPNGLVQGECGTGAVYFYVTGTYPSLTAGQQLRRLAIEFTVPDEYTDGPSQGEPVLPGHIPLFFVGFWSIVEGNTVGDPPFWPGEYALTTLEAD